MLLLHLASPLLVVMLAFANFEAWMELEVEPFELALTVVFVDWHSPLFQDPHVEVKHFFVVSIDGCDLLNDGIKDQWIPFPRFLNIFSAPCSIKLQVGECKHSRLLAFLSMV
jgi:hypothetical protein